MNLANWLVRAVAHTIPRYTRPRYLEEWQANLDGAKELALSECSIARGAVAAALAIDRTDPLNTGMTKPQLAWHRARWALAFLGSAAVLGVGRILLGGYQSFTLVPVDPVIQLLTAIFITLGLFASLGTLLVALSTDARRTAVWIGAGVLVILVGFVAMLLVPLFGIITAPVLFAVAIVVLSSPTQITAATNISVRRRVALVTPFSLLTLAIVAVGILHITVWNPLAKLPGMSLDAIYAAMAAASESPLIWPIAGWAAFWGTAAILLPVVVNLTWLRAFFTASRTIVTGLLMVGVSAAFMFVASFNFGMSLADTFMTSGADAAVSGSIISLVGQLALVAALLIGFSPRPQSTTWNKPIAPFSASDMM